MTQLQWIKVPLTAMSPEARKAYEAIEAATAKFESVMVSEARKRKAIGANETLRFSYKWNTVSIAKVAGKSEANSADPWDALSS